MPFERIVNSWRLQALIYGEGGFGGFNKARLLARKLRQRRMPVSPWRTGDVPKMNWLVVTNTLSPTPASFEAGARYSGRRADSSRQD